MKQKFSWKDWNMSPVTTKFGIADLRWVNHVGFKGFSWQLQTRVLILGDSDETKI